MQSAFEEQLSKFQEVVIVGTDCPLLGVPLLKQAFEALKSHNCVLGPSEDGGYYLIGLRRMISEIFRDIPWSTPGVLDVSLQRHPAAHLLPLAYDVDESADLHSETCRHGGRKTRARTPYNRMDFGFRPALSSNPQSEIRNPQSSYASGKMAECPGAISRRTGSSVFQRSIAIGQRGWKPATGRWIEWCRQVSLQQLSWFTRCRNPEQAQTPGAASCTDVAAAGTTAGSVPIPPVFPGT